MERNVFSRGVALNKGYKPGLYTYDAVLIPMGEYIAVLDYKIWSKRIIAINCYFTKLDEGNKFVVTVYCNNKTGRYSPYGSSVDFAICPLNAQYLIGISKSKSDKIALVKAEEITLSKA
ncbi:hypothetical protein BH11BAC5_BH11BAC5_44030 [soil metagenome]